MRAVALATDKPGAIVAAMKTALPWIAALLLAAPALANEPAPPTRHHADAPGIDWYGGDVNAAFATAQSTHRPVLLYWGATWCPPCQQLKATVFARPDFIAKSRLFVPVYLDGDEAGAQKWGETFRVSGYPTLVVLDAKRRELMRIAGGMDLSAYATVLDTALADLEPADALLDAAAGGRALDAGQCRRLAYNAWELEPGSESADSARLSQRLEAAIAKCPADARLERARLAVFTGLFGAHGEAAALGDGGHASAGLERQVAAIGALLEQRHTALEVADALQSLDGTFFRAVKSDAATAPAWLAHFVEVMDAAATDPSYAEADQLGAIGSKLEALKIIDGAIPPEAAKQASARVAAALAEHQVPYVRSGIINAVLPIYDALGQNEQAYQVVQGELGKTATPYYYMADLGELAEDLGRKDEALKWYAEGYAGARGPATRFQWGQIYATGLLRLDPDDSARIATVTGQVLGELDGPDRIYRRDRMRLARLDKALRKWDADSHGAHHAVIVELRAGMQRTCVKIPAGEPARASCDAFLAGA
jgi:thioredoxin-like negative regulator of GroEL